MINEYIDMYSQDTTTYTLTTSYSEYSDSSCAEIDWYGLLEKENMLKQQRLVSRRFCIKPKKLNFIPIVNYYARTNC